MITFDIYTVGLVNYEMFKKIILPEYEKKGVLNEDEAINLFLELREKHNIHDSAGHSKPD